MTHTTDGFSQDRPPRVDWAALRARQTKGHRPSVRNAAHFWGSGFRLSETTAQRLLVQLGLEPLSSSETGHLADWAAFWRLFIEIRDAVRVTRCTRDGELVVAGHLEWATKDTAGGPVLWDDVPRAVRVLLDVETALGLWSAAARGTYNPPDSGGRPRDNLRRLLARQLARVIRRHVQFDASVCRGDPASVYQREYLLPALRTATDAVLCSLPGTDRALLALLPSEQPVQCGVTSMESTC